MNSPAASGWTGIVALRLLRLVLVLAVVAVVAFALVEISPIDPIDAYLGADIARIGADQRAQIAAKWGLDQPLHAQVVQWAGNVLRGDLGYSMTYNAPVLDVLASRLWTSLPLMGLAWVLSGLLGYALGVLAGAFPNTILDRAVRIYSYTLASAPVFWIAILLVLLFSVSLRWTPVCCAGPVGVAPEDVTLWQSLHHLLLPLITLTVLGTATIALHTRAKMIEIMQSDYALYARAQGATKLEIAWRHGARNAALPAVTMLFASLGELFGGSALAEQVFAYPGLGSATVEAGLRGDIPLLLALALCLAAIVCIGNTIADILYRVVDPRMQASAHE